MEDIKYCSQKGLGDINQDFFLCNQLQDGICIAILADGMGGLQYGEIAADIVAQSIYETLTGHSSVDITELFSRLLNKLTMQLQINVRHLDAKWEQLLPSYI